MRLARDRSDGFASIARQRTAHFHVQRARLAALADSFGTAGVDWANVPVVERFDHSIANGESAAAQLLDANPEVTALICTSDILALGALNEAKRRGLRVPQDLTVTGFDGIAEAERVGLTTIRQPVLEKGRAAGKLLLGAAEHSRPRHITLDTELVVGHDVGAAEDDRGTLVRSVVRRGTPRRQWRAASRDASGEADRRRGTDEPAQFADHLVRAGRHGIAVDGAAGGGGPTGPVQ